MKVANTFPKRGDLTMGPNNMRYVRLALNEKNVALEEDNPFVELEIEVYSVRFFRGGRIEQHVHFSATAFKTTIR